ncbi:Iron(3+)-hydroxamate-binding protein FhuD precursor [Paenibacillus konkukensis]|uniref:Iron(3+)-hydroxamate-binding protein FhuD n=1 Tax=Paenibacillus konkukensis TaxID=2020716 RepID=A0ABY4RZ65_9BACL|nr:iron-hydroxamate ABC transporter substrate-binding protein [Paenibacillus konkukensis]UQZ86921.1 Iron(3+)-hydroxamate-binding protein FhuD precursor [Paenibacillus konkukensis]
MTMSAAKKLNMIVLAILLAAMLTACGKAPDTGSAQGEAEQDNETAVYHTDNGDIAVPKNPQRVVMLADSYLGDFLVLGIKPVGVTDNAFTNAYFQGKLDGIENLGEGTSLEKILELRPDLIVTYAAADNIEQLGKIAPTIPIPYGKKTFRDQLKEFGQLTSREAKADEWIAAWDKKIAEAKPKVQAAVGDKTVSILQPYAKGIYAFGHNYARGGEIIYGEFKLKAPQPIQKEAIDSGIGYANLSLEMLPDYAGDYIFTSAWSGDNADPEVVYGSAVWKGLPAVKNNKVFKLDPRSSLFNDPISLDAELDWIVEQLTRS